MPKRITIAPHLSLEELEHRYRQAKEPVERSHYQIIWLLASGRRTEDVAEITGYSRSWIYELVWGYNRVGPKTLGDGRVGNPGAAPILDDVQQANLWQALKGPAPDGGLWNGRKVGNYLSELIGQPISRQQGWEYLKQMRMRLRVPRPQHQEGDPEEHSCLEKKTSDGSKENSGRIPRRRRSSVE
jgi:transposase